MEKEKNLIREFYSVDGIEGADLNSKIHNSCNRYMKYMLKDLELIVPDHECKEFKNIRGSILDHVNQLSRELNEMVIATRE